ncbi:MAG: methyl-accepting chemotaxis protein [Desulfobacterales bacterium]|nr:methyl-accepting chemotaxis protein [Desulfobacterales bacterium]
MDGGKKIKYFLYKKFTSQNFKKIIQQNIFFNRVLKNFTQTPDSFLNSLPEDKKISVEQPTSIKILENITTLELSLESFSQNAEPHFIMLSESLQSIYFNASELIKKIKNTINYITKESEKNLLTGIEKTVNSALTQLESSQNQVKNNLSCINKIDEKIFQLYRICEVIEKTALFFNVIGLNINIECASNAKTKEMFIIVAHEIKNFSDKLINIIESIRNDAAKAKEAQSYASNEIVKEFENLKPIAELGKNTLENATTEIKQIISVFINSLDKAEKHSQNISRQISEVVIGIQFHDNMSQRISHIIKALNDTKSLYQETNTENFDAIYYILTIQEAQLKRLIKELNSIYEKQTTAFQEIHAEVESLSNSISDSTPTKETKHKEKDFFSSLISALLNSDEILNQAWNITEKMRQIAFSANEASKNLGKHIKSIDKLAFQTHIIGLNAIIKAGHIGKKGVTLYTLAQNIGRVSNDINKFVADVHNIIKNIIELIEKIQSDKNDESSLSQLSINSQINEISITYSKFKQNSLEVLSYSDNIKINILDTGKKLEFLSSLEKELSVHQEKMRSLINILKPFISKEAINYEHGADSLPDLLKRYTMQEERDIHQEIFKKDNDDNIELFEDINLDNDVELFDNDDSQTFASNENKNTEDDFGDNVELF